MMDNNNVNLVYDDPRMIDGDASGDKIKSASDKEYRKVVKVLFTPNGNI